MAKLLAIKLLERRLETNVMASVLQQMTEQVAHLVMSQTKVSTVPARKAVVNREVLPTDTLTGQSRGMPAISQVDRISKVGLGQSKPILGQRQGCQAVAQ